MKPLPDNWLEPFEPLPQLPQDEWCNLVKDEPQDEYPWPSESMESGSLFGPDADKLFERPLDDASSEWFDEQEEKWSLRDEGRSDGQGESYAERNT